jgi:aminodeoxyfutalosine deaminase
MDRHFILTCKPYFYNMPIYTADLIHDGNSFLPSNSAIAFSALGVIEAVYVGNCPLNAIKLEGLLCPGFVNAHCHLELSYLKGAIPKHTGLVDFLMQVNTLKFRNTTSQIQIQTAIGNAESAMLAAGIVAVGDISNGLDSLQQKQLKNLHYHTFVEIMGILDANAGQRIEKGTEVLKEFKKIGDKCSIVPHASYSLSDTLLKLINALPHNTPISIHNQECMAEDDWIRNGNGDMQQLINAVLNAPYTKLPSNNSSLIHYLQFLKDAKNILFVHNTYTTAEDVLFARESVKNRFWVLCLNANLYIENTVPSIIPFLLQQQETICLGTDSLASNDGLCIYSEMQKIQEHFNNIATEKLLQFATSNGALALNMNTIGTLAVGKQPGIVHISNWKNANEMPKKANIAKLI